MYEFLSGFQLVKDYQVKPPCSAKLRVSGHCATFDDKVYLRPRLTQNGLETKDPTVFRDFAASGESYSTICVSNPTENTIFMRMEKDTDGVVDLRPTFDVLKAGERRLLAVYLLKCEPNKSMKHEIAVMFNDFEKTTQVCCTKCNGSSVPYKISIWHYILIFPLFQYITWAKLWSHANIVNKMEFIAILMQLFWPVPHKIIFQTLKQNPNWITDVTSFIFSVPRRSRSLPITTRKYAYLYPKLSCSQTLHRKRHPHCLWRYRILPAFRSSIQILTIFDYFQSVHLNKSKFVRYFFADFTGSWRMRSVVF